MALQHVTAAAAVSLDTELSSPCKRVFLMLAVQVWVTLNQYKPEQKISAGKTAFIQSQSFNLETL